MAPAVRSRFLRSPHVAAWKRLSLCSAWCALARAWRLSAWLGPGMACKLSQSCSEELAQILIVAPLGLGCHRYVLDAIAVTVLCGLGAIAAHGGCSPIGAEVLSCCCTSASVGRQNKPRRRLGGWGDPREGFVLTGSARSASASFGGVQAEVS